MTTTVAERPAPVFAGPPRRESGGGGPARRAILRWAWRLFRREWRQQVLVLALLTIAVAATTAGTAVATNVAEFPSTTLTLPGSDRQLAADIAAVRRRFGDVEVVDHQKVRVPGSVTTLDLRSEATHGGPGSPILRLVRGRYPTGTGEVALTRGAASTLGLSMGDSWRHDRRSARVVALVENPEDLHDQFALVPAGAILTPETVEIYLGATTPTATESLRLPSGSPVAIEARSPVAVAQAAGVVLALSVVGLTFVGLVAVAGFTVMAQRRMRAIGMLGSLGATDRHVRLVMLANGAVVGATAALVGAALGLAGWLVVAPHLESLAGHRIDRFHLPWWAVAAAVVLAFVTSVAAAWWPAR